MAIILDVLDGNVVFTDNVISDDVAFTKHTIDGDVNNASGLMAEWGKIVGDLNDQTDLKNALDGKYDATNPDGFITGISSSDVTDALGYTPYNSTNPSNYITSSESKNICVLTINGLLGTVSADKNYKQIYDNISTVGDMLFVNGSNRYFMTSIAQYRITLTQTTDSGSIVIKLTAQNQTDLLTGTIEYNDYEAITNEEINEVCDENS